MILFKVPQYYIPGSICVNNNFFAFLKDYVGVGIKFYYENCTHRHQFTIEFHSMWTAQAEVKVCLCCNTIAFRLFNFVSS